MDTKRATGQYFTKNNPFVWEAFRYWANRAKIKDNDILEPFAGANNLIRHLNELGMCKHYSSYDISPCSADVRKKDTLKNFPQGHPVCITNPPWLAKNSASVRGIPFPNSFYDDLYKISLEKCLSNCEWVAALVPESFIRSGQFRDRLEGFISMTGGMFVETGHPVGIALFSPYKTKDVNLWVNDEFIGLLSMIEAIRPKPQKNGALVRFNVDNGNVGLIALDNTKRESIQFCPASHLKNYTVKSSGRHITKLHVDGEIKIDEWNEVIRSFRRMTSDMLMTCYKGVRLDKKYRRRCDWSLARGTIHYVN